MRILIADDEPLVRLGIRSMIEEVNPCSHTITEAANGMEVIAQAAQKPDLAFVDIKMPLLDGIQAIAEAKEISPLTQWVLVSGFSDFSYAQQAIRLNAIDYLLKPVSPAQLTIILRTTSNKLMDRLEARIRQFQSELMAYFYQMDLFDESQHYLPVLAPGQSFDMFVLCIDCKDRATQSQRVRYWMDCITQAFQNNHEVLYAAFVLPSYDLCLITQSASARKASIHTAIEQLWLKRMHPLTILIDVAPAYSKLYATYERMSALSLLRTVHGFDSYCTVASLEECPSLPTLMMCAQHIERVSLAYLSNDELSFRQAVNALQSATLDGLFSDVDLDSVLSYLRCATDLPLQAETLPELVAALLNCAQTLRRQTAGTSDIVEQIKAYVAAHYMQDIAISTLADELDITPNYLSKIFHQRAGCTFVAYLSKVRISAAQKLLSSNPDLSIYKVAEAVGYSNPRHFTKVFVKLTGRTPSVYQSETNC